LWRSSEDSPPAVLITGPPGAGKTTLLKRLLEVLAARGLSVAGFYTQELRQGGQRMGFELVDVRSGRRALLAHVDVSSPYRVSRYGVDLRGFENFLQGLQLEEAEVVLIDEVGKMECLSPRFQHLVRELLREGRPLIATVAQKGGGLIQEVKAHPRVRLITLKRGRLQEALQEVLAIAS
jgi:nucleoside-triphosphatase